MIMRRNIVQQGRLSGKVRKRMRTCSLPPVMSQRISQAPDQTEQQNWASTHAAAWSGEGGAPASRFLIGGCGAPR